MSEIHLDWSLAKNPIKVEVVVTRLNNGNVPDDSISMAKLKTVG